MMTDPWNRSVQIRLQDARKGKEKGLDAFKDGDISGAGEFFIQAIRDLIPILDPSEDEALEMRLLTLACRANLSLCQLKLRQFEKVIVNCGLVLGMDPTNVKCLYRRGCAYSELEEVDKASADFEKAAQLEPGNKAVAHEQRKIKHILTQQHQREAKMMKQYLQSSDH